MSLSANNSWSRDLVLLFLSIGLFFSIGLAARPYLTPSEARYIELPRQMLATHDWLTPHIDGVPYFEKPPLFYWMQAVVMSVLGYGEFAGRLMTLLLDTCICLVTYAVGRMLYGRTSGLLAAGMIATCFFGYCLSRAAMLDMPVSLFLTCVFACFLAAQNSNDVRSGATQAAHLKRTFYWLMYVAAALAVMTKGLIGIVIPGIVIGTWILCTKRWRILLEAQLIPGLIIVLIITVPWHVMMAMKHPGFLNFYFINEHFTRYLTDSHKRDQPWWFFIAMTVVGLVPWTGLTAAGIRHIRLWRLRTTEPVTLFLLLWILLPMVFFSTSHSKLAPYIFPIFPPLAIITGRYLTECWEGRISSAGLHRNNFVISALFTAAFLLYFIFPIPEDTDRKLDFASGITFLMLLPAMAATAGLIVITIRNIPSRWAIVALGAFAIVTDISGNYIVAGIDRATVKPLVATILQLRKQDNVPVFSYGTYFQDLPVYLNHNVMVVDYLGELTFGVTHYPETRQWIITSDAFWQLCSDLTSYHFAQDFFVLMKKTTFDSLDFPRDCPLHRIADYGRTVLLERHPQLPDRDPQVERPTRLLQGD